MDDQNLDKVLSGDVQAFRYFVEKYQDMAFGIAIGMSGIREEAEEIVQDAFIRAFRGLGNFRREAKFSSWLYRIVVNEGLKRVEKKKNGQEKVPRSELPETIASDLNDGLQLLERAEKQKIVQHVLAQLKPKEALVLQMHYLHEMSIGEIEENTGFSVPQVKVLLHRARKSFYAVLHTLYAKELRSFS